MTAPVLNDLDLDQLIAFRTALQTLENAGVGAKMMGLRPRFYAMPGELLAMTLDFAVPDIDATIADLFENAPPPPPAEFSQARSELVDRAVAAFAEADASELFEDQPAPVPQPDIAAAFVDAAPDQEAGGCPPGSASAMANAHAQLWSLAEDQLAVEVVAAALHSGQTQSVGIRNVQVELGRTFEAVRFRVKSKLLERIDREVLRLRNAEALAETAANVQLADALTAATVAPDPHLPEPPADADPLTAHLLSLPRKDGWTVQRDLDLALLSVENGWGSQDIAVDLGLDTRAVQQRWDALTGLFRDAVTGKQARRFSGRDVLTRLQTLAEQA